VDAGALLRGATAVDAGVDLAEVRGQAAARRALEIAAAGGHHLLLSGPPGAGKTMLARRLSGILPPMVVAEALEVTRVFSAAGLVQGLVTRRPFRAPHHAISFAGLTGGGMRIRPGEISLATHGVLFLDELPEFRRDALEALRQPVEEGSITVVRVHGAVTFPARFSLVASMNPCPCGHHGSRDGRCGCTAHEIRRYCARLSGPLLDRFDLVVDVPPLDLTTLERAKPGEASADVRDRVVRARSRQLERFGRDGPTCNAHMGPRELGRHAELDGEGRRLLLAAGSRLGLSARGFDRVRRVARTLADLEGAEALETPHVAEALQYRQNAVLGRD
jgi:magnesium chelatase family protein